jgi:hypothetical protein
MSTILSYFFRPSSEVQRLEPELAVPAHSEPTIACEKAAKAK